MNTAQDVNYFTPGVQDATNFKEFFIQYDGIENISRELNFTLFGKYQCKAGCKMCYLKDSWIEDDTFGRYVPAEIKPEVETRILETFDLFNIVGTIDDLRYLKNKHPHLYAFYQRNSNRMMCTSMTDTAFIQQYDLLINELNFTNVYEISFSDVFLHKKHGKLVDDIVEKLKVLHAKSPILKLKIVACMEGGETTEAVKTITEWAHTENIGVGLHHDLLAGKNELLSLDVADYQEQGYHAENSRPYHVISEVLYLHYTSLSTTLYDATTEEVSPYYDIVIDGFDDLANYITKSLQAKVDTYGRHIQQMKNTCGNKLFDYFSYVSSTVQVNKNFNFIPRITLKPWSQLYKKLMEQGWLETQYGLYNSSLGTQVTPLFVLAAKPKQKIYHIPIKNTPVVRT